VSATGVAQEAPVSTLDPVVVQTPWSAGVVANNGIGIFATGAVRTSQSAAMANAFGWNILTGGVISTYGDNLMVDNASNVGALTSFPGGKQ